MEEFLGLPDGFSFAPDESGLELNHEESVKQKLKPLYSLVNVELSLLEGKKEELQKLIDNFGINSLDQNLDSKILLQREVLFIAKALVDGNFAEIVKNSFFSSIVGKLKEDDYIPTELEAMKVRNRMEKVLKESVVNFIENGNEEVKSTGDPNFKESSLLNSEDSLSQRVLRTAASMFLGAALLQIFLQENSTGPPVSQQFIEQYYPLPFMKNVYDNKSSPTNESKILKDAEALSVITGKKVQPSEIDQHPKLHQYTRRKLETSGETPYGLLKLPHFLHVSRIIFRTLSRPTLKAAASDPDSFLPEEVTEGEVDITNPTFVRKTKESALDDKVPQMFRIAVTRLSTAYWWCGRSSIAHLQCLEILSQPSGATLTPLLKGECSDFFDRTVRKLKDLDLGERGVKLEARCRLEQGIGCHFFGHVQEAKEHFEQARSILGLEVALSGALGKRTRYQKESKAQLVLKTKSNRDNDKDIEQKTRETSENLERIKLEQLDQDTPLLEHIEFDDESGEERLSSLEECIVLALCVDVKNSYAMEALTAEQMSAHVDKILKQGQGNWLIYSTALLVKSNLEFERFKTKERAVLQLQLLVDQQDNKLTVLQNRTDQIENSAKADERLLFYSCLTFPLLWRLKLSLAKKYLSIGVAGSALELCLQCRLFESAVECLTAMDKKNRAIKLVEHLLDEKESNPNLLCQMGILTNEAKWFEKAWRDSKFRHARSQRLLARFHFDNGDLKRCVESFSLALKLNPLFVDAWFKMGVCCLKLEDFERAKHCFLQVISQEPTDGDAYANLSVALEKLGKKELALDLVEQAVKYNRTSWRLWENHLRLGLDLKDWSRVLIALNRLIDLKIGVGGRVQSKGNVDVPALIMLVDGIITSKKLSKNDEDQTNIQFLVRRTEELFSRIKAECKSDSNVWKVFAVFFSEFGDDRKVFDCLMRRVRSLKTSIFQWERNESSAEKVVKAVLEVMRRQIESEDVDDLRLLTESTITSLQKAKESNQSEFDCRLLVEQLQEQKIKLLETK